MELNRTGNGHSWIQVAVPTGDPDVRRIATELRKTWKRVWSVNLGWQVTDVGMVKITMVNGAN